MRSLMRCFINFIKILEKNGALGMIFDTSLERLSMTETSYNNSSPHGSDPPSTPVEDKWQCIDQEHHFQSSL